MKTRFAIGLALAAGIAGLATPASAQFLLPPYEITTSARSMGLQPVSRPVLRGNRYVFRAIDGRGYEMRVAADAFNGRIIAVRPVGYRQGPAYAERFYPPGNYPAEMAPPRGYPADAAPPPRGYERPPARIPSDPPVIYAPGSNATPPQPSARPPSAPKPAAAKPAAPPKVAAQPAKPPAEAKAPEPPTGTTGATSSPPENSAVAVPPVQTLE